MVLPLGKSQAVPNTSSPINNFMLTINQPIVLANSHTIEVIGIHISRENYYPHWQAVITLAIRNEKGEDLKQDIIRYQGEDFNTFWINFNSGKFLYDEYVSKNALALTVPSNVEDDFTN